MLEAPTGGQAVPTGGRGQQDTAEVKGVRTGPESWVQEEVSATAWVPKGKKKAHFLTYRTSDSGEKECCGRSQGGPTRPQGKAQGLRTSPYLPQGDRGPGHVAKGPLIPPVPLDGP